MKRSTIPAALALLALSACSSGGHRAAVPPPLAPLKSSSSPATAQINLTIPLSDQQSNPLGLMNNPSSCSGAAGYSDVANGAELRVTDPHGGTLASTILGDGTPHGDNKDGSDICSFDAAVSVPVGYDFYNIQIGPHEANPLQGSSVHDGAHFTDPLSY